MVICVCPIGFVCYVLWCFWGGCFFVCCFSFFFGNRSSLFVLGVLMHGFCRRVIVLIITHVFCLCLRLFLFWLLSCLRVVLVFCVMFLGWGVMGKVFFFFFFLFFFLFLFIFYFYLFVFLFCFSYFFIFSLSVPDLSLVVIVNLLTRREWGQEGVSSGGRGGK